MWNGSKLQALGSDQARKHGLTTDGSGARQVVLLGALSALLLVAMIASLHLGIRQYTPAQVWGALVAPSEDPASLIVRTLRLPRMLIAPLVGAGLATAGLVLQTVSRNPLASPDLLGINAGAAFAVVLAVSLFGISALLPLTAIAALGALVAILLVFALSAAAGGTVSPVNTLLAGVTLAAFLASGTQIILTTDESTMENLIFWLSGSFVDRDLALLSVTGPILVLAIVAIIAMSRTLDVLMADDASAEAIGVPVARVRAIALVLVALISAAAVTTAGPVAFVGLVAPHIARRFAHMSHAHLIPATALIGAALAMSADVAARFIIHPAEAPVGAVLALVGVPALIALLQSGSLKRVRT